MPETKSVRRGIGLVAIAAAAYLVTAMVSGGASLPTIAMPTIGRTGLVLLALLALGGVYAVATKRGWRKDVRYLVQVVSLALIAYLVGRELGPMIWGWLP